MDIRVGSQVEYKVGRGWGKGKVSAIINGVIFVASSSGKIMKRSQDTVRKPS